MISKKRTGHNHDCNIMIEAPVLSGREEVPGWLIPQPISFDLDKQKRLPDYKLSKGNSRLGILIMINQQFIVAV
jgi:hypothetical protein